MADESYKKFNCYGVLSISATATPEEIKVAYRKASLKAHPDVGGSNEAQAKVNLAYEVLSDPLQRNAHDAHWRLSAGPRFASQDSQRESSAPNASRRDAGSGGGLSGLRGKLERAIRAERVRIWNTVSSRRQEKLEELRRQYQLARRSFLWAAGISGASLLLTSLSPLFWIGAIWGGLLAASGLFGADVVGRKVPLFGLQDQTLVAHAEEIVRKQCESEAGALDRRNEELAHIVEMLARPSSQYDDEIYVARRISAALFVMGYAPISYDGDGRMMFFADGDEKLVVRFRHRDGQSLNVNYVEKLHMFARAYGAKHALLFCSPGLSGNAAAYAKTHGITPYTLERMNSWINSVASSGYAGPGGDILEQVSKFSRFSAGIAPSVSRPRYGGRRRYRRYR